MTDTVITEVITDSATVVETVDVSVATVEIIEVALQGPQGIQGIPGAPGGSVIQCVAGENISGHRAIRVENGLGYYCNSATLAHAGTAIGMSTQAATLGDVFNVQTLGNVIEPSWNWTQGPVFVGTLGQLTQLQIGVFHQQIGIAVNTTELNVNPQLAIIRS